MNLQRGRCPRPALVVTALALMGVAAGCSSAPPPAPSTVRPAPTASSGAGYGLSSVTPASIPSEPTAATAREAQSPDPAFDYGFVVQITPEGFRPQVLVAACCAPIVWINLTDRPNTVAFDVESGRSGPIAPGQSWAFTPPNAESISYHSLTFPSMHGALQVNQTSD